MKKRSGRPRAPAASRQSGRTQAAGGEEEKRPGNRGRPRKAAAPAASDGFDHAAEDETADGGVAAGGAQKHPESKSRASGGSRRRGSEPGRSGPAPQHHVVKMERARRVEDTPKVNVFRHVFYTHLT